ncbi:MAG TPA: hypothetical protein V6D22_09580 [Candidatus Obscuribacterales bacterium]
MANLPPISMTTLTDFVLLSGVPRLTHVRRTIDQYMQDYDPATDWYRGLRKQILHVNEEGLPLSKLFDVLDSVNPKKHATYIECIEGYKKFHGIRKPIKWLVRPVPIPVVVGGLPLRVNPELKIEKDGQQYVVKLYFKDQELSKKHAELLVSLMERVYPPEQGVSCAVLDVRTGRFHDPFPSKNVDKLLESEAVAFVQLWNRLVA